VNDLRDNTYFALLGLRMRGELRNIDARPSDAIALALRSNAPIFVEGQVMRQAAITEGDSQTTPHEDDSPDFSAPEDVLEQLNVDLLRAVQEERYEEAAKIRDQISKIKAEQEAGRLILQHQQICLQS